MKPFFLWTLSISLLVPIATAQSAAPPQKPLTIETAFAEGGITGRGPESMMAKATFTAQHTLVASFPANIPASFKVVKQAAERSTSLIAAASSPYSTLSPGRGTVPPL